MGHGLLRLCLLLLPGLLRGITQALEAGKTRAFGQELPRPVQQAVRGSKGALLLLLLLAAVIETCVHIAEQRVGGLACIMFKIVSFLAC